MPGIGTSCHGDWRADSVSWIKGFNREDRSDAMRRGAGLCVAITVIAAVAGVGRACATMLPGGWPGPILAAILAWPLIAARSITIMWIRRAAVDRRRSDSGMAGRIHYRRARSVTARCGRHRARGDREPSRKYLRRNRRAAVLGRDLRPAGHRGVQGHQHAGLIIGHRTPRHQAFGWRRRASTMSRT